MNRKSLLGLMCVLHSACFSPDATDSAGGASGTEGDSATAATETLDAGETGAEVGGTETGLGETGADETGADETGADETGADETGAEETGVGGTETGVACEEPLGTPENCLDCGDACEAADRCGPDGCATPFTVGFDEAFNGTGGFPNRLWGFPVQISDGWLTELNIHATGNGGDIQLSLYADDAGVPSGLIVASDVLSGYAPGEHALPVEATWLDSGTYWLMARNETPSHVGLNFDPDIPPAFTITAVDLAFDAELPEQLEDTITFNSYELNLFATLLAD